MSTPKHSVEFTKKKTEVAVASCRFSDAFWNRPPLSSFGGRKLSFRRFGVWERVCAGFVWGCFLFGVTQNISLWFGSVLRWVFCVYSNAERVSWIEGARSQQQNAGRFPLQFNIIEVINTGTSLAVYWLKTLPSKAGGVGSTPGRGAKVPHASWPRHPNIKEKCCGD